MKAPCEACHKAPTDGYRLQEAIWSDGGVKMVCGECLDQTLACEACGHSYHRSQIVKTRDANTQLCLGCWA